MPRKPTPKRYDVLRVRVLDAKIVPRERSGRSTIQDVLVTLRKPAGEVTRAYVSLATLRSHGLFADGHLSVAGGEYEVRIRGLGDGRSIIREWGALCTPSREVVSHELDIALTQLRACGLALGLDPATLDQGNVFSFTSTIIDTITRHERTVSLAQPPTATGEP